MPRIFPGWFLVVAAHLLLMLIFGAAYSFGAFFTHLQQAFDAGRFSVASIFSATAFLYYATGIVSGTIADRISTRMVVAAGIIALSAGFFGASFMTGSLSGFLIVFCSLVGLGVGLVYVPTVTAVQRWFVRNRAAASGLALSGTGVGTFVGPVAAGALLTTLPFETTLRIFAAVILVLGLVATLRIHGSPAALGLRPDGDPAPPAGTARRDGQIPRTMAAGPAAIRDTTLAEAARTARFHWYFAAILFGSVGLFLALVHINPYAQALGLPEARANLLIGLIGAGNIGGRLFLGRLGDRMGPLRLLVLLTFALALLNGLWLAAGGFAALAVFAVAFGAANGGCIALYPAVAAGWFGTRHLGAILGTLYLAVGIAAIAGGSLAGLLFDLTRSYATSILSSGACALLSVACIAVADRRRPVMADMSHRFAE
ncbi:MFS transporter (plasmid) [Tistrella mobilis]|uniref:MFS transporter n=1 Tax=Tistrella mobilis TaxID=171437 RepID=UPI003557170D